jgi:multiple sugar transport system permease protein
MTALRTRVTTWFDNSAKGVLLAPAIFFVLFLSIFPLLISLFLAFSRVDVVRQTITFVGLRNFDKLLFGTDQRRVVGSRLNQTDPGLIGWVLGIGFTLLLVWWVVGYFRKREAGASVSIGGVISRVLSALMAAGLVWLLIITLSGSALPGSVVVTIVFALGGVTAQYLLGLGLAMLLTQTLPGKRFFRIVFLMPMMMTPVGIGFLFRMLADTGIGPLSPLWRAIGLSDFSWIENGATARLAILVGDTWQWTPFMFIILLAALEGTSREQIEAALVDGASRWQVFRYIIIAQIAPVSVTVIFIRLIEAFKIIDLPQIMTGGAPGGATETLTLLSFIKWRAPEPGPSAAVAYILLIVVTFIAIMYVNLVRNRVVESL